MPLAEKRILYLQYVNPAAIPPLIHSSDILSSRGWTVTLLGVAGWGQIDELSMPERPNRRVIKLPLWPAGLRQRIGYARFVVSAVWRAVWIRPSWVYVSDVLACPPALFIAAFLRSKVVYHEHDSPDERQEGRLWLRVCMFARRRLVSRSALCVLPQTERARIFREEHDADVVVVLNCPRREEVPEPSPAGQANPSDGLRLLYQGSIDPAGLPLSLLHAIKRIEPRMTLDVIGYETIGSAGYSDAFLSEATSLELVGRVTFNSPLSHDQLLRQISEFDVGLALTPIPPQNPNQRHRAGASNKPFDYLAAGLPLIVSDLPDWQELFVDAGYGVICDPRDPTSIADAIMWYVGNPKQRRAMGAAGRARILEEWNYETQFEPVLKRLEGSGAFQR